MSPASNLNARQARNPMLRTALKLALATLVTSAGAGLTTHALAASTEAPGQPAASAASAAAVPAAPGAATPATLQQGGVAIVIQDQLVLRAAARDSSQQYAVLSAGEVLEVRGERLDFLQVYDHRRERGGFVRTSRVKRLKLTADEAPELQAVLRFVRDTPGSESLGIGLAAAWLKAAPAAAVNGPAGVEVLDSLGSMADRLAARASGAAGQNKALENALAAHLDVARNYGLTFPSFERDGRIQVCYDGDALRRVMGMAASDEQKAKAALALTRPECGDPAMRPLEHHRLDQWRNQVLEQAPTSNLSPWQKNRVHMRHAAVLAALAYQEARLSNSADLPAGIAQGSKAIVQNGQKAIDELALVQRSELTEEDLALYNDAVMRVSASRWAAVAATGNTPVSKAGVTVRTDAGESGQTCLVIQEAGQAKEAFRKCSYSVLWPASTSINAKGSVISIAAQPTETWREMWLVRKTAEGWVLDVLPPAPNGPETGYAEFAGFTPDGQQVLVARESRVQSRYKRSFEVVKLDGLVSDRSASDASLLSAFKRWQDPSWKRGSLSLR